MPQQPTIGRSGKFGLPVVIRCLAAMAFVPFGNLLLAATPHVATVYSFDAPRGAAPHTLLTARNGEVFGISEGGGAHGRGTVFRLGHEGTPEVLHDFTGGADGETPTALVEGRNGVLYGATAAHALQTQDGTIVRAAGTLFVLRDRGPLVTLTRAFSVEPSAGFLNAHDEGGPIALAVGPDGALYGATVNDGAGFGTLFRRGQDGTLSILHSFTGGADGSQPGTLILGGDGNFYGTTAQGGVGSGTVFRLAPDGAFLTLAALPALVGGTATPSSLLWAENGDLYGGLVASISSVGVPGAVFQVTPAGAATILQRVGASPTSGAQGPRALLQSADGNFYGTTFRDGDHGSGTLFRLTPAGALTTLHSFAGGADGESPNALTQTPGRRPILLGTTSGQPAPAQPAPLNSPGNSFANPDDFGTLFRWRDRGGFETVFKFEYRHDFSPNFLVRARGGSLYGTTTGDPFNADAGTIFNITPSGEIRTLYRFTGGADGANPTSLTEAGDGNFYGRTSLGGGPGNGGTLFRMTPEGTLTTLHSFDEYPDGQGSPLFNGPDGNLYGSNVNAAEAIFRLTLDGSYSVVGVLPSSGMFPPVVVSLLAGSDGALYGTTQGVTAPHGLNMDGTIFRMTLDGQAAILAQMEFTPTLQFQGRDGRFYGTVSGDTFQFGSSQAGSVFVMSPQGQLSTLFDFAGGDLGLWPNQLVETPDGDLVGTTLGQISNFSGPADYGSVFRLTMSGNLTTLRHFDPNFTPDGDIVLVQPVALVEGPRGMVYGAALRGGKAFAGSIFEVATDRGRPWH